MDRHHTGEVLDVGEIGIPARIPDQAEEVHAEVRGIVAELVGTETSDRLRILYGGSVKPDNIDSLMAQPDVDGALVGGASLKKDAFLRIMGFKAA